ncbi:probable N-acetyltransferase 16 isoform X2 [Xenopus laevis]|uniref:N-acetyltransferase domain-containing protein n=4 Tax=Xenopus laevis TaxID=8355 RepID=A0A974HUL6_XENLA|nr:probable N-acetyltransferase 16 isoform X2 [Xenopus laevis]XP_041443260.1 probable N-acetyltransferase 16 isoform X2 [Xenopus laevis]XP_041443261.1 probable N-acetyltransferase 16 isoform X2 [Xenopus laevis]OCT90556.1 hypothetical protein XELAEV_18019172mg [Xenopus laevis]
MSRHPRPDVEIFQAASSDYTELMSISEGIYRGVDPLPFKYHEWLADPQRKMFLAKFEEQVVGFMSFLLVDNGTTAVAEGLRVAPWIRGCGIAKALQKFCLDNLRSYHPKTTRIRFTGSNETPPTIRRCQQVHSKSVISVQIPYDQMEEKIKLLEQRLESVGERRPVVALGPSEVLHLFKEPSLPTEGLLPNGLLIQSWVPLSTHRSNLELLLRRGVAWFYSQPLDSRSECAIQFSTSDSLYTHQEPSEPYPVPLLHSSSLPSPSTLSCGFLSLGTPPFPVPLGDGIHRFDIDLFGTDPISAQTHVLHQLIEMQRVLPSGANVVCYLFAEKILSPELTQFFQGLEPFYEVTEQQVFEREV